VRTGAECNPGACYTYLGVKESEVESLAGKKEGCHDDIEFLRVQRSITSSEPNNVGSIDACSSSSGRGASPVPMQWTEVPLGSVRASLGYMSTFEDCYWLVQWVKAQYKDRV
jgi:molybdenum cofactor sulfurtransferase